MLNAAFTSTKNITFGRDCLAVYLNNITLKRDFFNKWNIFRVFERGIYVGRGESKSKVVVRNWTRRHTGDKA